MKYNPSHPSVLFISLLRIWSSAQKRKELKEDKGFYG